MAYTPTNWQTGDTITAAKLNNIETGISNATPLIISYDSSSLVCDHTAQEIHDAAPLVWLNVDNSYLAPFWGPVPNSDQYSADFFDPTEQKFYHFVAASGDEYPIFMPSY